jgi:hypothetical protein
MSSECLPTITLSNHHYIAFASEAMDVEFDGKSVEYVAHRYIRFLLRDKKERYLFLNNPEAYEKSVKGTKKILGRILFRPETIKSVPDTYIAEDGSRQWTFDWFCQNICGNYYTENSIGRCKQLPNPPPPNYQEKLIYASHR